MSLKGLCQLRLCGRLIHSEKDWLIDGIVLDVCILVKDVWEETIRTRFEALIQHFVAVSL
jgi:hypothetical protein